MFEQELFNFIRDNFFLDEYEIEIYFSEAPQTTKAPYIVLYPLNIDGTRTVICNDDDFTDGESLMQFSIYDIDPTNAFYIKHELMKFLQSIEFISHYRVLLDINEGARGGLIENTGLFLETITQTFRYTKNTEAAHMPSWRTIRTVWRKI